MDYLDDLHEKDLMVLPGLLDVTPRPFSLERVT